MSRLMIAARGLSGDQKPSFVDSVADGAANYAQREYWDQLRKVDETQIERRAAELQHQPAHRDRLHPDSEAGDKCADGEQAVVAVYCDLGP